MQTGLCVEPTGHTSPSLTASSQVTQRLVYSQSLTFQSYYEKIILSPFMDFVVEEKHNPLDVTSNQDFIYLLLYLNPMIVTQILWSVGCASLIRRVKVQFFPCCQRCVIKKTLSLLHGI